MPLNQTKNRSTKMKQVFNITVTYKDLAETFWGIEKKMHSEFYVKALSEAYDLCKTFMKPSELGSYEDFVDEAKCSYSVTYK